MDMHATPRKGPPCVTGELLKRIDPEVAADIIAAMIDPLCSSSAIAAELSEQAGHLVRSDSVNRHRRTVQGRLNGCACRG